MDIIEEVPGALKKSASWMHWASEKPFEGVDPGMLEQMQCFVHANGDKSFILGGELAEPFDAIWDQCLLTLKEMNKQVSRSDPRFEESYGLIETKEDNLQIKVYRDSGKVAVLSRHKRGWGISDGSESNILAVVWFWKTLLQIT